ncbi:arylsulfatase [Nocardia carnea]|uniref:arylsulfatase n=1 Tax=Nocardia carnea TaxID=37328 RepID=UPI0024581E61|nr:arylsulfatase [Nocardia carnea]
MDRHSLPIVTHTPQPASAVDYRSQSRPFHRGAPVRPPQGAPNILVIMIDDVGFGAASAFGGPCRTPTAERLAQEGLGYTRFHTTALCSPTRAAMLTGRNHHSVGMGVISEMASAAPGYNGTRPASAATVARILQGNGYATGAFGKMHQTPAWEITPVGPFDRWPCREGFDKFYGFLGAESDQFNPVLYEDFTVVEPPRSAEDGYHLSEDLVDRAAAWIEGVHAVDAGKPWFCYLPFGACHAPLQVPDEYLGKYRGEFDHGWDRQREITLERQKRLGVVPEDTLLAPWAPGLPHWDSLDENQRKASARLMELYAAFLEHTDDQVGRLVDRIEELGALDNTLVLYMLGDNGASAEGGMEGSFNYLAGLNGYESTTADILDRFDELGTPTSYPHYPAAWALALDTPYQWAKQVASHYGGTRNGLIVRWPAGIAERGELRHQWHHCVDLTPTILEAAGVPAPHTVDGVAQMPMEGVAMNYTFNDAAAEDRHTTQYFEIFGNRGIYHEGWTAVTAHRAPWLMATAGVELPDLDEDRWELYDTRTDWSQARDLAAEHPEILARLKQLFLVEAAKYQVLPLDDRTAGRHTRGNRPPHPFEGRTSITLYPHMQGLVEKAAPSFFNRSFRLTAQIDNDGSPCEGMLAGIGGRFGGFALYVLDAKPVFCYNFCGREHTFVRAPQRLPAGKSEVALHFDYDGGGIGKGATVTLFVDGVKAAEEHIERTARAIFSMNEQLDIGVDRGSPVTEEIARSGKFSFTGTLHEVRLNLSRGGGVPESERRKVELATH